MELARKQVADLLNCDPREIVWTSGATESDNLAIKGIAQFYKGKGKHLITSKIEHKAVLDPCRQLEREGFEVTYLNPLPSGLLDIEEFKSTIREDTILASFMHVNNEIGVIQDLQVIGDICRENKVFFHVDAAQSVGKMPINLTELPVDLMSFSAHKMYGPKGVGILYVRRKPRVRLEAQMHGGGHERGMRSGTLATAPIGGYGRSLQNLGAENQRITALRQRLWDGVADMEEVYLNGSPDQHVPGIVNISFAFVEGESLIMSLPEIALSSGSACTSASLEPSYVLRALGMNDELAHSSLRFSVGRFTTEEDVDGAIEQVRRAVEKLRELSPLWDMYKDGVDLDSIEWAAH